MCFVFQPVQRFEDYINPGAARFATDYWACGLGWLRFGAALAVRGCAPCIHGAAWACGILSCFLLSLSCCCFLRNADNAT